MTEPQADPRPVSDPGPHDQTGTGAAPQPPRTPWAPLRRTPLRQFLQTETGSAAILAAATVAALIWANACPEIYASVLST